MTGHNLRRYGRRGHVGKCGQLFGFAEIRQPQALASFQLTHLLPGLLVHLNGCVTFLVPQVPITKLHQCFYRL